MTSPPLDQSERERWQQSAREQMEITRKTAMDRDWALAEADRLRGEYERVNLRAFEHRAEIERLRNALEDATDYLRLAFTWIEDSDRHVKMRHAHERARMALGREAF